MDRINRFVFGSRAVWGFPIPIILWLAVAYFFRDGVDSFVRAYLSGVYRFVTGRELSMTPSLAIFVIVPLLVFFALFFLGAWWQGKRSPRFFVSRKSLNSSRYPKITDAEEADICLFSGANIYPSGEDWPSKCRVILPDPNSDSLKQWASFVEGGQNVPDEVRTMTQKAKEKGADVKWYPLFIGQSWWIGKVGHQSFYHVENVFPSLGREFRQSYRVFKWQEEASFKKMEKVFAKMWSDSKEPY
jgi:hypothetical protein